MHAAAAKDRRFRREARAMSEVDLQAAQQRYSTVAIALHWIIALAIAFQLALGFSMPKDERGFELFQLHKSVGITILLLSLARLAWRLTHRPPPAVEGGFQGFLAKAVHTLIYVFMIGMPLTGWAVVSTSRIEIPTVFWGVIPWPHLPISKALNGMAEEAHEILAWIGIALILLHVAGALRHQFLIKDGLLRRVGPGGSAWAAARAGGGRRLFRDGHEDRRRCRRRGRLQRRAGAGARAIARSA
jgi:cytochrome b561